MGRDVGMERKRGSDWWRGLVCLAHVVELLGDTEPGGPGPRVGGELSSVRLDGLAAEQKKRGPMSAGAVSLLGRT
jgi:hypothetical protein